MKRLAFCGIAGLVLLSCQDPSEPTHPRGMLEAAPHRRAAIASADALAYVTDQLGSVHVISTASNDVVATIATGGFPFDVAATPDGAFVYVTNFSGNSVHVIQVATNDIVATIPVGNRPRGVAITPDGSHAWVTNFGSGTVSVIATASNSVVATLTVGQAPTGVAITPDGAFAYVTVSRFNSIVVINTATRGIVAGAAVGTFPFGVTVSPDGAFAYVANFLSGTISVIATATNTVAATITVGANPRNIAFTKDGAFAYVPDNSGVSVIETATRTVVANPPVGMFDVAFTPDDAFAYVTNTGRIDVIEAATHTVTASIAGNFLPFAVTITSGSLSAEQRLTALLDELEQLAATSQSKPLANRIEHAAAKVEAALAELSETPPDAQGAIGALKSAGGDIEMAIELGLLDSAIGEELLDALAGVARQLAADAIDAATQRDGDARMIADAQSALAKGDEFRAGGAFRDAIDEYKHAAGKAESS